MENTLYIRNWRPNVIWFRYAGLKYVLERRGDKKDVMALPLDAKSDPTISRWLKIKQLEEITSEQFIKLSMRVNDGPFGEVKAVARSVNIPLNNNADPITPTPGTIDMDLLNNEAWKKANLSPNLEFINPPLSTEEELALQDNPTPVVKRGRPKKVVENV